MQIHDWIHSIYKTELKDITNVWVKNNAFDIPNNASRVVSNILNIQKNIKIDHQEFSVIALRCNRNTNERADTSIYCFIYLDINMQPVYVNISPSLTSMDGEYRRRFIPYIQLETVLDAYTDVIDSLDEYVRDDIHNANIILTAEFVPSFSTTINASQNTHNALTAVMSFISESTLPMQLYIIAWIIQMFYSYYHLTENHINKRYYNNIFALSAKQQFITLIERWTIDKIKEIVYFTTNIMLDSNMLSVSWLECGQKIIPMTNGELRNIGDISYPVWREIYCNRITSDLVINNVFAGVSIFSGWTLLTVTKNLFDNDAMYNKLYQSDNVKEIIMGVKQENAKISLHETLMRAFDNPFEIAEDNIILSDYAIIAVSEYVGRTFADMPMMIAKSRSKIDVGDMFNDEHIFNRYMFDIIYGLYCCNSLIGIMHGDLHLNNCTINPTQQPLYISANETIPTLNAPPHIYYKIDKYEYLFPHRGAYSCLIDFSRAVLEPTSAVFSEANTDGITDMKNAVMTAYSRTFPEFFKQYSRQLEIAILQSPCEVYRLFTAYDTYSVMSKLVSMLSLDTTKSIVKINPKNITFLNKIVKLSRSILLDDMVALFDTKRDLDTIPYPNRTLIDTLFSNYLITNYKPECIIMDVYIYRPLVYSLKSYETSPKYVQQLKNLTMDTIELLPQSAADARHKREEKRNALVDKKINKLVKTASVDDIAPPREQLLFETSVR